MSNEQVARWCQYCRGELDVEKGDFDTLFMEELSRPELVEIFSFFPNSSELVANVEMFWRMGGSLTDEERRNAIEALVAADVQEKLHILRKEERVELTQTIERAELRYVKWSVYEEVRRQSDNAFIFQQVIGDYVLFSLLPDDRNTMALYDALYYLGNSNSLELRWSIMAPVFVNRAFHFRSYLELHCIGGRYTIGDDTILYTSVTTRMDGE